MRQIALPFGLSPPSDPARIVAGPANAAVLEALDHAAHWPFLTAVLAGPPRSGKSLLARWFAETGRGDAIDDADRRDETDVFHLWNRAQESGRPLLLVASAGGQGGQGGEGGQGGQGWQVRLPDLASRLGAALQLKIGAPDDATLAELIALHAERRGFVLDPAATSYLVPRCERSHMGAERLVEAIDRLSLERKQPPTLSIWREAIEELAGRASCDDRQPRLL